MATRNEAKLFVDDLVLNLVDLGRRHARPAVLRASTTLANGLEIQKSTITGHAKITIPHFWAVFVHDGRNRPILPKNAMVLVWYKNKADDPRFPGGSTPKRASQIRKLTRREFIRGLRQGKIIVARKVTKRVPGSFFFENNGGMAGFRQKAGRVAQKEFSRFVVRCLGKDLKAKESIDIVF